MSKKTQSKKAWKNVFAGGCAGALEAGIMYPAEFVKTQLQLAARSETVKYTGVVDCATKIVREKGVFGLYRGVTTLIVGSIPKAGVRFGAYSYLSQRFVDEEGKLTAVRSAACGMASGCIEAMVAVTPMETVKTKLIHDANSANPKYNGLIHGVSTMVKQDGIGSIYKGLAPTMARQATNQGVRFTVYNFLNDLVTAGGKREKTRVSTFGCGMGAGFVSVYVTMPIDVVKTQMQGLEAKAYKNSLDCILTIARNKGIFALWKGTTPRLGRVTFSGGIIFSAYEIVMDALLKAVPDN